MMGSPSGPNLLQPSKLINCLLSLETLRLSPPWVVTPQGTLTLGPLPLWREGPGGAVREVRGRCQVWGMPGGAVAGVGIQGEEHPGMQRPKRWQHSVPLLCPLPGSELSPDV